MATQIKPKRNARAPTVALVSPWSDKPKESSVVTTAGLHNPDSERCPICHATLVPVLGTRDIPLAVCLEHRVAMPIAQKE